MDVLTIHLQHIAFIVHELILLDIGGGLEYDEGVLFCIDFTTTSFVDMLS